MTQSNAGRRAGAVDAVVIGAGHAGLAASYFLNSQSIEHVVLERGEIANSWRHERWDSLTLLTPNWQSRLPGYAYAGDDPDGYMSMPELIRFIDDYAHHIGAPVRNDTDVISVKRNDDGYAVETSQGRWSCRAAVIATGACNKPAIPAVGSSVPAAIESITAHDYRRPGQLADGGVLVVGASATGLQLADEIHRSGRPVSISVGEHVRLPRVYRGKDIQWWMKAAGILDEGYDEVEDIVRARRLPSPQLVGCRERQILDLNAMSEMGVRLVGRLMGFGNDSAQFSGSLRNVCALADLKMGRLLGTIDEWADLSPDSQSFDAAERFERTRVEESPPLSLPLNDGGIRTILWATGYRPDYSWLDVPVMNRKGQLVHDGGVVDSPGLYVLGLPVLRKRQSSFIHGIEDDARFVVDHLAGFLAGR